MKLIASVVEQQVFERLQESRLDETATYLSCTQEALCETATRILANVANKIEQQTVPTIMNFRSLAGFLAGLEYILGLDPAEPNVQRQRLNNTRRQLIAVADVDGNHVNIPAATIAELGAEENPDGRERYNQLVDAYERAITSGQQVPDALLRAIKHLQLNTGNMVARMQRAQQPAPATAAPAATEQRLPLYKK